MTVALGKPLERKTRTEKGPNVGQYISQFYPKGAMVSYLSYFLATTVLLIAPEIQSLCPHPQGSQRALPGMDGTVGHGFDLAKFAFPIMGNKPAQSAAACVVKMTTTKFPPNEYTDKYANNTNFLLWDQVDYVAASDYYIKDCNYLTFNTIFEFQEWMAETVSSGGFFGLFSASESFSQFFSFGFQNNMSYVHCKGLSFVYDIHLRETRLLQPDDTFLEDARNLPSDWSSLPLHWPKWLAHFEQYGTHFVRVANMGGGFVYDAFVESFYAHAAGSADLQANADLAFLFALWLDGSGEGSASGAASAYLQAAHYHTACYGALEFAAGCDNQKNDTALWEQWLDSIPLSPYMYNAMWEINSILLPPLVRDIHLAATAAYLGWQGLKVAQDMLLASLAVLKNYTDIVPNCSESPICRQAACGCTRPVDNTTAPMLARVRACATRYQQQASDLYDAIANATQQTIQAQSMKLPSPGILANWTMLLKNITLTVFSRPTSVDLCTIASCYHSSAYHCPVGPSCNDTCCWSGQEQAAFTCLRTGCAFFPVTLPCSQRPGYFPAFVCHQALIPSGLMSCVGPEIGGASTGAHATGSGRSKDSSSGGRRGLGGAMTARGSGSSKAGGP